MQQPKMQIRIENKRNDGCLAGKQREVCLLVLSPISFCLLFL
jgi:hypothetical protein